MTGTRADESAGESALVASLCVNDESAFAQLVDQYTVAARVARRMLAATKQPKKWSKPGSP